MGLASNGGTTPFHSRDPAYDTEQGSSYSRSYFGRGGSKVGDLESGEVEACMSEYEAAEH